MRAATLLHACSIVKQLSLICLLVQPAVADQTIPPGPFKDAECVICHSERDPGLVSQWRDGPHAEASATVCSSCHGDRHEDSNANARSDQSCIACHEGPASHSYTSSKHGVINRLNFEKNKWSKPLRRSNYRAPSCSYCHLHGGDHGDTMAPGRGPEVRQWICTGCHSPRYIRELFANGERQLEIADLKLEEGEQLIGYATESQAASLSELKQSLLNHRQNVLYGVGHQSPDYQWWHGQPALDGDLIRIREIIGR